MGDFLPEKYQFSHDYCFFLHDILAGIITSGEEMNVFSNVRFEFRETAHIEEMQGKSGEALAQWLEDKGYANELHVLFYKQIFVALLSDFCHFVYEALQSSKKGKLSVTYALLRKPFKENLLLLEWLLADPAEFMSCFTNVPSQVKFIGNIGPDKKKEIIAKAIENTKCHKWISSEFIYELRYEKSIDYSFDKLWDEALHIVTNNRFIKTEDQNLNFVFSDYDSKESQWEHLYSFLPFLLFHTNNVIDALVDTLCEKTPEYETTRFRGLVGMLLWLKEHPLNVYSRSNDNHNIDEVFKNISELSSESLARCPNCNTAFQLNETNMNSIYADGELVCGECGSRMRL